MKAVTTSEFHYSHNGMTVTMYPSGVVLEGECAASAVEQGKATQEAEPNGKKPADEKTATGGAG